MIIYLLTAILKPAARWVLGIAALGLVFLIVNVKLR